MGNTRRGPVVEPLPPKTRVSCRFGHIIKTRQPPGTQLACSPCGQEGRKDVTVTVPAPLPSIRPETAQTSPEAIAVITRRKTGPERWHCAGCLGSAPTPAPGEPPLGWLEVRGGAPSADGSSAVHELLARACSPECLARVLPQIAERMIGRPWAAPEPGPGGNVGALMREVPRRRG